MKILYLACARGISLAQSGGAGTKMRETINAFRHGEHEVLPIILNDLLNNTGPYSSFPLPGKAVLNRKGPLVKFGSLLFNLYFNKKGFRTVISMAKEFEPDLIYERSSVMGFTGLRLKESLGIPLILEWCGPAHSEWSKMYNSTSFNSVIKQGEMYKHNGADILVMPSHVSSEYFPSRFRNKVVVSGLGANTEMFSHPIHDNNWMRKKEGFKNSDFIVLYVGTFAWYHGLEYLIEALDLVKKTTNEVKLLLIGDGPGRQSIEQMVQKRSLQSDVVFTGLVDYSIIPSYLTLGDVAVLPDCTDYIYPEKLIEYGAAGCPVIAPNKDVVRELLIHEQDAILVDPGVPSQIADSIVELKKNTKKRLMLARNLKSKVESDYNWNSIWNKVLQESLKRIYAK